MSTNALLVDLQTIVGTDYAHSPVDRSMDVDDLTPSAIVLPGTYEEVAAVTRFANTNGHAVIVRGAASRIHFGNVPRRYDIVLSLSRLNNIIEHEPADMTITCQAGTTAGALENLLNTARQMVPFQDIPDDDCTIGGLLGVNHCEQPAAYGAPRDFTVGMRVVTADGRITRAGGQVVKNVAGYDLCKLYIGSMGTLGVIVEATLKLIPLPQATRRVEVEFDSIRQGCAFASEVRQRGLSSGGMHIRRFEAVIASFDLAGTPGAVDRSYEELQRLATASGGRPPFQDKPSRAPYAITPSDLVGPPLAVTASILPSDVPLFMEAIDDNLPPSPGEWIDPAVGMVGLGWLSGGGDEHLLERVREIVRDLHGTLLVRACSLNLKRQIDVFGDVPPKTLDLMRRVKHQFDPNGILSPGRFVGKL